MTGLGEACIHVAAILFYVETYARMNDSNTCTQHKCKWVTPSYQKDIPFVPVKDLDLTSARSRKAKVDATLLVDSCTSPDPTKSLRSTAVTVMKPDDTEKQTFTRNRVSVAQNLQYFHL